MLNVRIATPTMGGIIIVMAIVIPCLLWARLDNVYILLMLFVTLWLFMIGFIDDYIKVYKKNKEGLKAKTKLAGQIVAGLIVALTLMYNKHVLIRLTEAEATQAKYEIVEHLSKTAEGQENMVHARALSTIVRSLRLRLSPARGPQLCPDPEP